MKNNKAKSLIDALNSLKNVGESYSDSELQRIWVKGAIIPMKDPNKLRKDQFGSVIAWDQYGKRNDQGWEVDHIHPKSKGGSNDLSNLQPLHWKNNRAKNDSILK